MGLPDYMWYKNVLCMDVDIPCHRPLFFPGKAMCSQKLKRTTVIGYMHVRRGPLRLEVIFWS